MSRPTRYQIAKEVADVTKELKDEGKLDEWGVEFGMYIADNILHGRKKRRVEQQRVEKVE